MTGLNSLEESNEGACFTVEKFAIDCFVNVTERKFTLKVHPNIGFKFTRHFAAFHRPAMFSKFAFFSLESRLLEMELVLVLGKRWLYYHFNSKQIQLWPAQR